jgi:hypothetical protein
MIIRKEQMDVLSRFMLGQFENEMIVHLRSRFQSCSQMKDGDLRTLVRGGVERAGQYEIVKEYDVRRYLEFMVEYGDDFDRTEWAAQILTNQSLSGTQKMDRIDDYTLFVLRDGHQ